MIKAKVIADSISGAGKRITTLELEYPRFFHSEFLTHRVFSRNAMSSRAIPVAKMIKQVQDDPAMPIFWGKNQPGMQAKEELTGRDLDNAKMAWQTAAICAAAQASLMNNFGLHKQIANRILEPFQNMRTLVTSTEWDNFFELRDHPDAQPEFQALARCMREAMSSSYPCPRYADNALFAWHLPYITVEERFVGDISRLCKISVARCARVSYLTHGGDKPRDTEDLALYERLVGSVPRHASPTEHQALAHASAYHQSNNFRGWTQFRESIDSQ